jgi:hypothetical protein
LVSRERGIIDFYLFSIAPKVGGVVIVRLALAEVTEPMIEALTIGLAGRAGFAESPLADETGRVAGTLQQRPIVGV